MSAPALCWIAVQCLQRGRRSDRSARFKHVRPLQETEIQLGTKTRALSGVLQMVWTPPYYRHLHSALRSARLTASSSTRNGDHHGTHSHCRRYCQEGVSVALGRDGYGLHRALAVETRKDAGVVCQSHCGTHRHGSVWWRTSTRLGTWRAPMSSTTSKRSTTEPAVTAISAASAPRRLNAPRLEAGVCLLDREQSNHPNLSARELLHLSRTESSYA